MQLVTPQPPSREASLPESATAPESPPLTVPLSIPGDESAPVPGAPESTGEEPSAATSGALPSLSVASCPNAASKLASKSAPPPPGPLLLAMHPPTSTTALTTVPTPAARAPYDGP